MVQKHGFLLPLADDSYKDDSFWSNGFSKNEITIFIMMLINKTIDIARFFKI